MAALDPARMARSAAAAERFLKLLANRNRLMIVCALVEGERSVGALEATIGLGQPALSQQIAALRRAGLVVGRRQARTVLYRLADDRAAEVAGLLYRQFCTAPASPER